ALQAGHAFGLDAEQVLQLRARLLDDLRRVAGRCALRAVLLVVLVRRLLLVLFRLRVRLGLRLVVLLLRLRFVRHVLLFDLVVLLRLLLRRLVGFLGARAPVGVGLRCAEQRAGQRGRGRLAGSAFRGLARRRSPIAIGGVVQLFERLRRQRPPSLTCLCALCSALARHPQPPRRRSSSSSICSSSSSVISPRSCLASASSSCCSITAGSLSCRSASSSKRSAIQTVPRTGA